MEPRHPIEKLGIIIAAVTFVGLGATKLLRLAMGLSERAFMETRFGGPLIWTLSALFILGLMFLFPIGVYLRTRKAPAAPRPKMPWWGVFAMLIGSHNPDWEISPWIHIPLRILMACGFLFVVVIGVVAYLNSK